MRFKGDIIITDPCYIINEEVAGKQPKLSDYKGLERITGSTPFSDYTKAEMLIYSEQYSKDKEAWHKKNNHWELCECGRSMDKLGLKTYLSRDTLYGDWSCTTYEDNKQRTKLGTFCADAGMVAVFLLEEVLKYNPSFDYHIKKDWTTTLIKDFDGEVSIDVVEYQYADREGNMKDDEEVRVIGKGNINFFTSQTGF